MPVLAVCAGGIVVGAIVWEVFADLFHPGDRSALSDWLGRGIFQSLRVNGHLFPVAGPLAIGAVIVTWVVGLVLGFALIYVAFFPEQFRTSTGAVPATPSPFLSTVHFSFETLITLGYGDIVPRAFAIQMVSDVEGMLGFGVLTASLSEIVLLYPALSRMRMLARGVAQLVEAEQRTGACVSGSQSDVQLARLTEGVTHARIDLVHFPMVYYFVTRDADASVARWTRHLCRFAREGMAPGAPPHVRVAAGALDASLTDFARLLADRFLDVDRNDREAAFEAYAADHAVQRA